MSRSLFRSVRALLATTTAVSALTLSPMAAHAQFNLNAGTDKGILELASYNTQAGGGGAVFRNDGLMLQAGGGYRALNGVNTLVNNTGLVNLPAAINSGQVGNFGGGTASLFTVSGNRAGVFTNSFGFKDNNVLDGVVSLSAMYGQGAWTYNGPAGFFTGGAYLSMTASVDPLVIGSYVEAGVDALFKVNGVAVGEAFITFGFDGVANPNTGYAGGPLQSFIGADRYTYVTNGQTVAFNAASYVQFRLNPGDVLSIQGTLTAFGDPASMDFDSQPGPGFNDGNDNSLVSAAAPEPTSIALILPAAAPLLGIVLRRRRRTA